MELVAILKLSFFIMSQIIFYLLSSSAILTGICIKWEGTGWNSLRWGKQLDLKGYSLSLGLEPLFLIHTRFPPISMQAFLELFL